MEKLGTKQNEEKVDSAVQGNESPIKIEPGGLYQYMPHTIPWKQIPGTNLYWDIDDGLRLYQEGSEEYKVQIMDHYNQVVLHDGLWKDKWLVVNKKWHILYAFSVFKGDQKIFEWAMNPEECSYLITMPEGTVGDSIAWISYCIMFKQKWRPKEVWVQTNQFIIDLFKEQHPEINWCVKEDIKDKNFDAVYRAGLFFQPEPDREPMSHKVVGLGKGLAYVLDVPPLDIPPKVKLGSERKIKEKYVCIAVQASSATKMWNNPLGWDEVIDFLKQNGYRVLCIDRDKTVAGPMYISRIPNGCEDFTGNIPLQERVELLEHADMFIGCSSGLSWLAWCVGVPRIIISGFTDPQTEPYTPFRVISFYGCHGCWNMIDKQFDNKDYMWCPMNKQFECTKMISSKMVINKIIECMMTVPSKGENNVSEVRTNGSGTAEQNGD